MVEKCQGGSIGVKHMRRSAVRGGTSGEATWYEKSVTTPQKRAKETCSIGTAYHLRLSTDLIDTHMRRCACFIRHLTRPAFICPFVLLFAPPSLPPSPTLPTLSLPPSPIPSPPSLPPSLPDSPVVLAREALRQEPKRLLKLLRVQRLVVARAEQHPRVEQR